ncbi:MAG: hypothetical protein AAGA03_14765 [Planctomycetota bacterium]
MTSPAVIPRDRQDGRSRRTAKYIAGWWRMARVGVLVTCLSAVATLSDAAEIQPTSYSRTIQQQGVTLSVRLDRTTARVLEPIELTIEITAPDEANLQIQADFQQIAPLRVSAANQPKEFPTLSTSSSEAPSARRVWRQQVTLETLDVGSHPLPTVTVLVDPPRQTNDDGVVSPSRQDADSPDSDSDSIPPTPTRLSIDLPAVRIVSVLTEQERQAATSDQDGVAVTSQPIKPRPLKEHVDVPVADGSRFWKQLLAIGIPGLLGLGTILLIVQRGLSVDHAEPLSKPLKRLEKRWQRGEVDDAGALRQAVRLIATALADRVGRDPEPLTEAELQTLADQHPGILPATRDALRATLDCSSEAKFAGRPIRPRDTQVAVQVARQMVRQAANRLADSERAGKSNA